MRARAKVKGLIFDDKLEIVHFRLMTVLDRKDYMTDAKPKINRDVFDGKGVAKDVIISVGDLSMYHRFKISSFKAYRYKTHGKLYMKCL